MASPAVTISCPSCKKTFKGRTELEGKKIRCPACEKPFVVKLDSAAERAPAKAPAGKGVAEKAKPAEKVKEETPPPPPEPTFKDPFDEDDDPNPYGVTTLDMAPRCPNCANEMEDENAVICLYCGYNTQTRTLGELKKTVETTTGYRMKWLAPGLACAAGVLVQVIACMYYCLVLPYQVAGSWWSWLDHESMRLWLTSAMLFEMWPMGYFAFKRLILQPTPPEILKD